MAYSDYLRPVEDQRPFESRERVAGHVPEAPNAICLPSAKSARTLTGHDRFIASIAEYLR